MISAVEQLGAIWTRLASAVSVVYVFGYLAFKARLNSVGVRTELALLNERYLAEGARFLASSLEALLYPFALFVALGLTALAVLESRFQWVARLRQRAQKSSLLRGAVLGLFWFTAVVLVMTIRAKLIDEIAVSSPGPTNSCPGPPTPLDYRGAVWLTMLTLTAPFLARRLVAGVAAQPLHVFLALIGATAVLVLPMVYGSRVAPGRTQLDWVMLTFKGDDDPVLGGLMLETEKTVVLCAEGRPLASYPYDDIRKVETICTLILASDKMRCAR